MNTARVPGRFEVGIKWWSRLSVAYPWIWLCSAYVTWLVAVISLGRVPRPLLDDPKLLSSSVNAVHTLSVLLLLAMLPLGLVSVIGALVLAGIRRLPWRAVRSWLAALFVSWALAIGYGRMDPGRVVAWFID